MSTRAVFTFKDQHEQIHIYRHSDGYPTGAADAIMRTLAYAWKLPRFEADEFAAAFVAANKLPYWLENALAEFMKTVRQRAEPKDYAAKTKTITVKVPSHVHKGGFDEGGGIRILDRGQISNVAPADIAYRYEIGPGNSGEIRVTAYKTNYWNDDKRQWQDDLIISCPIGDFEWDALAWERSQERYMRSFVANDEFEFGETYGGQICLYNEKTKREIVLPIDKDAAEKRMRAAPHNERLTGSFIGDEASRCRNKFLRHLWNDFAQSKAIAS